MAYVIQEPKLGVQGLTRTETVQSDAHKLGDMVKGDDPVYGTGEFIYLKGVASTAIGDLVIYDQYAGTTKRAVAGDRGPCAVAMSANVASQFGWYQIAGASIQKTVTVAANGTPYLTATPGSLDDAVVAGDKIDGARFKTADGTPSAGYAIMQLDRPSLNGNG